MELHEALSQISEIRAQIARTETFGGFRSLTVGFSGVLGIAASVVQADRLPRPMDQIWDYIDLWAAVAVISLIVVAIELIYSDTVARSTLRRRLTLLAIGQFVPCLIAGGAVTLVIAVASPETAWMLPGLWAVLFSLGVFACSRLLPRPTFLVGAHYLISGTVCLAVGKGDSALAPWMMAATFGVGQLLAAAILYVTLERRDGQVET
jgi:hypothetical protein